MWIDVFYQYSPDYVILSTFLGISCFKFNSVLISRATTKLAIYEFSNTLRKKTFQHKDVGLHESQNSTNNKNAFLVL